MVQWQNFPIAFGGVDSKTDPKKVVPGKLLALQNGVFTAPGQIRKRNGYSTLATGILGGGSIAAGAGLASFNSELLLFDGSRLYSYSPSQATWANKGAAASVNVTTTSVTRNTYAQTAADSATIGNIQVFAWEDSRGNARYSVQDTSTGVFLVQDALLLTNGTRPKVIAFGTTFLIFVVTSGGFTVQYYSIGSSTPTSITSLSTLVSTLSPTSPNFDVTTFGGKVYVGWVHSTASTIGLGSLTTAGGAFTTTSAVVTGQPVNVGLLGDSTNSRVSVLFSTSTDVQIYVRNSSTLAAVSNATLETVSSVANVAGIITSGTTAQVYYTVSAGLTYNYAVRQVTLTNYSPGSASVYLRSVGLAAKPFLYSSTVYVPLAFASPLQPTYFVADGSGNLVAKLFSGSAGGLPTRSVLAESVNLSTGVYRLTCLVVDLLTTQPSTTSLTAVTPLYSLTGINSVVLNFADSVNGFLSATLANNLHVGGGFLSMYDGGVPVEHGFHVYPEGVCSYAVPLGGSLSPPSGTTTASYQCAATYEWTDNQGQIHLSSPTSPSTAYLGAQGSGSTLSQIAFTNNSSGSVIIGPVTSSVAYSAVSSFGITAALTSGNVNVPFPSPTFVSGLGNMLSDYIFPGMSVTGTNIPAGAYITTQTGGSFTLSAAPTGTVGSQALTLGVNQTVLGTTVNTSKSVSLPSVSSFTFFGQLTLGSNVVPVLASAIPYLVVGQTVSSPGSHLGAGGTITAVNTTNNTITLSVSASGTCAGYVVLTATYVSTGTLTSGSPNITGCSAAAVAYAASRLGLPWGITGTNIPASTVINSASGTTIVMSANATASTGVTFTIWFSGDCQVLAGQSITGTNIPSNTTITSVGTGTFTISNAATGSGSGVQLTIPSTYALVQQVPTLRLTAKQSARSPVSVVTYRTVGNGAAFYRSSSVSSLTYNDPTVDSVSLYDSTLDASLVGAPTLYTTGSVLENQPPNATSVLAVHKSRLFALDSTNPTTLWYSKQVVAGSPVEFSGFLTMPLDPLGGAITGLASMDDKLVVFKGTSIYYVVGDGPDATGANNNFSSPVLIPTDTGCVNPRSVVLTPLGLMFQGQKGLCLLTRKLEVQYVGSDVEGLLGSNTITSSRVVQSQNQARFTLSNGTALVYDLLEGQWGTFTNHQLVDAAFYAGNFTFVKSSGVVWTETPGAYTDNGAFIPLSLTTSWLQFAGIQGFQRVRRMLVYGDWVSAHNLVVGVAYDFNSTIVQTDTIPATSAPAGAEQYRVFFATQKCQAVQLTLSDTQNGAAGESVRMSGFTLECGTKRGLYKVSASNSFG